MVFEQIWHRLCGSPGCQIEHFLAPLDFYLARSAGRRSVRQGEAKLGRCRCRWSAIAGGSLLARRAGGAACYCPAATCYGGHSVQLNSCQSQLGEMSPLRIPLGILFFFCFFSCEKTPSCDDKSATTAASSLISFSSSYTLLEFFFILLYGKLAAAASWLRHDSKEANWLRNLWENCASERDG